MNNFYITQTENAKDLPLPGYMSAQAAGMDLYANVHEDIIIQPKDIILVPTGIKVALPDGYEAQIRPRSGLALKYGITMANSPGTIDADYRGEIKVILIHLGQEPFTIHRKDRIAQMVVHQYTKVLWQQVEQLPSTARGEGGFGHSGL